MEFDKSGQKATQSTLSESIQQLLGQKEKIQALVLLSFFVYPFISGFGQNEYYFHIFAKSLLIMVASVTPLTVSLPEMLAASCLLIPQIT